MDDNIIIISNSGYWRTTSWKMVIDLAEIVKRSGKRFKDGYNGCTCVDYPLPRAKKLMKLITEYASEEDLEKCDRWFQKHPKLWEYWTGMRTNA